VTAQQRKTAKKKRRPATVRTKRNDGSGTILVGRQTLAVLEGEEDLSSWTDEELIAGRKHNGKNGNGRALPAIVPIRVHQELVSRVTQQARHTFAAELKYAVEKHMKIIKHIDEEDPTPVQLKAIAMLYERILGKPVEHVALYNGGEVPGWKKAVTAGIVGTMEDGEVIEGEIVGEEA